VAPTGTRYQAANLRPAKEVLLLMIGRFSYTHKPRVKSRKDIEAYVLQILKEIYWEFPDEISLHTTFEELERYADADLTDIGLLVYIEADLGVYLPDEEVDDFIVRDVATLIETITKRTTLTESPSEDKPF